MPSFEEDAFARAQQMHRRRPQNQSQINNSTQPNNPPQSKPQKPSVSEPEEAPVPQVQTTEVSEAPIKSDSFLNALFKDKDQSIILLLIVLLMEENSNPTLLIALIYLLI